MQGGAVSPTGHVEQLDRTFEISLARLDPQRRLHACARRLLARSAYFAPGELLPRDLLFASLPEESPEYLRRVLSILVHDLGLLEMPNAESLRIHPLLAAFVREQALDPQARQAVVDALLNENRRSRSGGVLLNNEHLRQLRRLAHNALSDTDLNAGDLALALGEQLWFRHDPAARPFVIAACGIYSAIGNEQDDRLGRSLNLMGLVALMLGNLDLAWESTRAAVELRSRHLPPDHYDLLMSRSNTGFLHMVRGEYAAAETVLHDVLRRLHRHPAIKVPQLLRSIHNRGISLLLRGRYRAAERFLRLAMTQREAQLGPEAPALAQSLTYLAETLRRMGRRAEVEHLHKRAYAIRAGLFGAWSPIACENLRLLGLLLCEDGRPEGLLDLQQADTSLQRRYGNSHVETVLVRQSLGLGSYWQGDYERAERALHAACAGWERLFGAEHNYTATAMHYLALTAHAQGDQHRAYQYIDRAIRVSDANLGPEHPDTLASRRVCRQFNAGIDSSAHPAREWGLRHALIVPM